MFEHPIWGAYLWLNYWFFNWCPKIELSSTRSLLYNGIILLQNNFFFVNFFFFPIKRKLKTHEKKVIHLNLGTNSTVWILNMKCKVRDRIVMLSYFAVKWCHRFWFNQTQVINSVAWNSILWFNSLLYNLRIAVFFSLYAQHFSQFIKFALNRARAHVPLIINTTWINII